MRSLVPAVAAIGFALSLADAFPGACCSSHTVTTSKAGEECGHHGPRHSLICDTGLACYELQSSGASSGMEARLCTRTCAGDADCASLGAGFACRGAGVDYSDRTMARVCAPVRPGGERGAN